MACTLTTGRKEPCKDAVGGLTKVYFGDFDIFDIDDVTYESSSDAIASITSTGTLFQYDLKGTSSFEQTITSSRENGTTFYDQTSTLQFKKLLSLIHI